MLLESSQIGRLGHMIYQHLVAQSLVHAYAV